MFSDVLVVTVLQETSKTTVSGTAAGTVTITGAAAGTVHDHVISGTAAGTVTFTGSATGKKQTHSAAPGTVSFTGSAVGHILQHGTAAGSVSFTGVATGTVHDHVFVGTAAGTVSFTGAATGHASSHAVAGTAAGVVSFTGVGVGAAHDHLIAGTAAAVITIVGAAVGMIQPPFPVATPLEFDTTEDELLIRQKIVVLSPAGSDGSATADGLLLLSRPGFLQYVQIAYLNQAATTDVTIQADSSAGATIFTAAANNTDVSSSPGNFGVPFATGLYISVDSANVSVSHAKDIAVTMWVTF